MEKHLILMMLAFGSLLIISVFASKTSTKIGFPILLIFIGVGMLSGSEGIGGIFFDDAESTRNIGTIALIFILFSGGLSTHLDKVLPVWKEGVTLAIAGVLVSTTIMSVLIHYVMDWNWVTSSLLGAAISSTDAAAVFGILKSKNLELKPRIQSILELESGSNDPMAVFLTISLISFIKHPETFTWGQLLMDFFIQMSLGAFAGWLMGKELVRFINWLNLELEGLYPVLTIAGVICIYSLTEYCGGNGFLSVYLAGVTMGGEKFFSKKTLGVFHDGIAWLMQVAMFLALGLLVFPSDIPPVIVPGLMLAGGLMFLARPLSTLICLLPLKYSLKEIWFISWGGLRGAVPIILATYALVGGVPESKTMFNLVFAIVILCMLVQGTSLDLMACWMGVQEKPEPKKVLPFKSRRTGKDFIEYEVPEGSPLVGKAILEVALPEEVLVVLIHRKDEEIIPRGNTHIEPFDRLVCLVSEKKIAELDMVLRPDYH